MSASTLLPLTLSMVPEIALASRRTPHMIESKVKVEIAMRKVVLWTSSLHELMHYVKPQEGIT